MSPPVIQHAMHKIASYFEHTKAFSALRLNVITFIICPSSKLWVKVAQSNYCFVTGLHAFQRLLTAQVYREPQSHTCSTHQETSITERSKRAHWSGQGEKRETTQNKTSRGEERRAEEL
eukprot:c21600_g1_i2 orf=483-839(+)